MLGTPGSVPAYVLSKLGAPRAAAVAMFLGFLLASGLVVALAQTGWKNGWRQVLPLHRVPLKMAVWAALAFFALFLLTVGILFGADRVVPLKTPDRSALPLLVVALAAPLFEELLFRGYGLAWLREKVSDPKAMVLTAAAFALSHHPIQYLTTFAFGFLLAWLALRTRSLLLPILGHMAWNSSALLLDRLAPELSKTLPTLGILFGISAVAALLGWALRRLRAIFNNAKGLTRPPAATTWAARVRTSWTWPGPAKSRPAASPPREWGPK